MATREQADRALAAHTDAVLANPNVSSVSVIEDDRGDSIIEIGLVAAEGAGAAQPAPDTLAIPDPDGSIGSSSAAIRVRKRVIGRITVKSFTGRYRPSKGGVSCGPDQAKWFGTLGARVTQNGKACILSNWHVLYDTVGTDGTAILQPAFEDGGTAPADAIADNLVGVLTDQLDAALAVIRAPVDDNVIAGTKCYGAITGTKAAADKMSVKKCGRTSESTTGTVTSTNASITVGGYPGGKRTFKNQIQTTVQLDDGDSGSILLDDGNHAVGLLFAGSTSTSYANPIDVVISTLNLSFD